MSVAQNKPVSDLMQFELVPHYDTSILEVQVSGRIEHDYFIEMISLVQSELRILKFNHLLYHNMGTDSSSLTLDNMKTIVHASRGLNTLLENGKLAAVLSNKLSYGLARMWYALSSADLTFDFEIHSHYEHALQWIHGANGELVSYS